MYSNYFGFIEPPFSIAPDPRFLYLSDQHREALAHLSYGIDSNGGGFVLLTGEVGTGKTTVCRCLLERLPPNTNVAIILNPRYSELELLAAICDELHIVDIADSSSLKGYVDAINRYLLQAHAAGQHTVLIIDEAQNLDISVLEQVRLLTNLETNQQKLLQIILLGQPELLEKLARPELRQLSQRITARYHLGPLSRQELQAYVRHRLSVAGLEAQLFPPHILRRLYRLTGGIPRLINVICDRALLGTYVQRQTRVDDAILNQAGREVMGTPVSAGKRSSWWVMAAMVVIMLLLGFTLTGGRGSFLEIWHQAFASAEPAPSAVVAANPAQPSKAAVSDAPEAEPAVDQGAMIPSSQLALSSPGQWRWPYEVPQSVSQVLAFRDLFATWGVDYDAAKNPSVCRFAISRGLGCLAQQGDLTELRRLNRPAVLTLFNDRQQEFFATLVGIDAANVATLQVAGKQKLVALGELDKWWLGDYTLLWRLPPDYQLPLRPGSQGKAVAWLANSLAKFEGRNATLANELAIYDSRLTEAVERFQSRMGLVVDGVAGPQTCILLSTETDSDLPLLIGKAGR